MTTKTEAKDEPPKKPDPRPITSGLAFSGICNVRNTEAHLRWLGAQLSFFLNLPAFGAVALRLIAFPAKPELVLIFVGSIILIAANFFLLHVLRRDTRHLDLWNDKLDELERVNGIEGGVEIFSSRRYRKLRSARQRLQRRLDFAMICCMVGWGVIAAAAVVLSLSIKGGQP